MKANLRTVTTDDGHRLEIDGEEVTRGWESYTGWYWFATDTDVDNTDGFHFGHVQGLEDEWGYFDEQELLSLGNRVWEIKEHDLPYAGRR